MKFNSICFLSLFSMNIFASDYIAEVVKIRGEATQLSPGAKSARAIGMGDKFVEDTSILTGAKSFVRLKFIDNSEVNLGPDSKIVVSEMKKGEPGIISLLKGRIRTEVEKSSNTNTNKFFIKTRTAAMGVRGTEFQTIYNPDNKVTSLLTYRGEVAMAKIDDNQFRKLESAENNTVEITRNEESKEIELKKVTTPTPGLSHELNKILKSEQTVLVPPGQNSIASEKLVKATLPVQISPVQLNILYKNDEFKEKETANNKALDEKNLKNVKLDLPVASQKAPIEGLLNTKTGDFAPKAGGFIDAQTGLYIAPDADAVFDASLGVYRSDKSGNIDKDTGAYIAPAGLKLDAQKGFVLESETTDPTLVAMKNDLNGAILKDIIVPTKVAVEENYNLQEKFVKNELQVSLMSDNQKLKINANQTMAPFYSLNADQDNFKINFEWKLATAKRYRPLVGGEFANVNFKESLPQNFGMESRKNYALYIGAMYALSKNWDAFIKVGQYQDHYVDQSATTNNYTLRRIITSKLSLGMHGNLVTKGRWSLEGDAWGTIQARKRLNMVKVKEGGGLGLALGVNHQLTNKETIYLGIYTQSQAVKVSGEVGENRQERTSGGLNLRYAFAF